MGGVFVDEHHQDHALLRRAEPFRVSAQQRALDRPPRCGEYLCDLAWSFWEFCKRAGYVFSVEPLLAYATQMLCGNPYLHTLRRDADLWATDHAGCFDGELPKGGAWRFEPPLWVHLARWNRQWLSVPRQANDGGRVANGPGVRPELPGKANGASRFLKVAERVVPPAADPSDTAALPSAGPRLCPAAGGMSRS